MSEVLSEGKEGKAAFVKSMKHAPNLARCAFTNAVESQGHKSLISAFPMEKWKPPGVAGDREAL